MKGSDATVNAYELDEIQRQRERKVYKSDILVNARYTLSVPEQRLILYAISLIKKDDTPNTFYTIDLKDFCNICGISGDSYTYSKRLLDGLHLKRWYAKITPNAPDEETSLSWFNKVKITRGKTIKLRFDDDIFPFIKDLLERYQETGQGYTSYMLQSVLPMKSKYSIRLYEIFKSKIKGDRYVEWFFELDDLKKILECTNYTRYPDFRRKVIEPAIEEINKFSDLLVEYYTTEKRNISRLYFKISRKTKEEIMQAHKDSLTALDGAVHYWDFKHGGDDT